MASKKYFIAPLFAAFLFTVASCGEQAPLPPDASSGSNWIKSLPDVDNSSEISSPASSELTVSASDSPAVLAPGAYTEEEILSFSEGEDIFGLWMNPDDSLDVLVEDMSIDAGTRKWYHSDNGKNFSEKELFWEEELTSRLTPNSYFYGFSSISTDGTIYLIVAVKDGERVIDSQIWKVSPEQKLERIDVNEKDPENDLFIRVSSTGKATLSSSRNPNNTRCYDMVTGKQACKISVPTGSGVDGDYFANWNYPAGNKGVLSLYDMNTGNLLQQHIAKKAENWDDVRVGFGPQEVYLLEPKTGIFSLHKETGEWKQLITEKKFIFNEIGAGNIYDIRGDSNGNIYYAVREKGLYKLTYDPNGTQEP